jgi:4-oxalocrotonate tautomerase
VNGNKEKDAIAAVLRDYFDGLHFSDTRRLRKAFHSQAHYFSATDGSLLHLDMARYFPIVDARPSPASRGCERTDRILSIELEGPVTALARVECSIPPKCFTDLLILVKVDGRWQIVAKVFHYELRGPVA